MIKTIIETRPKISLIIDESTTISQLSSLIIYIRTKVPDMTEPTNIFIDIVELNDVTAEGICNTLLNCLESIGFSNEFLKENLISIATDGAAVMMGKKKGVVTLMKQRFPQVLIWHCANHRLELSVGDVIKRDFPSHVNHFRSFLDKLYSLYHQSPKNARELKQHAELLEIEILKIGRILGTRWVASSFRSVSAVWKNFKALVAHFTAAKDDKSRESTDRAMYEGLLNCITKVDFILDLAIMCDALQELSELSLELQSRDITLYSAQRKIRNQLLVFKERKVSSGPHYCEALKAEEELNFRGIMLEKGTKSRRLEPSRFYDSLKQRMENRLLQSEDIAISECAEVLDSSTWPENPGITYGETSIKTLCRRFGLPERGILRGFRDYVMEKKMPASLLPLLNAVKCVPISTSECERGFSQMNLIITPTRASFHLSTVSNLMFVKLVGPPLQLFQPMGYVRSWFMKGRHLATDTKSKRRKREDYSSHELMSIWKLL